MGVDILSLCPCGHLAGIHSIRQGCSSCDCTRVPEWDVETVSNVERVPSLEANEAALFICRAFRWSETKQGSDYWRAVHANLVEIGTGLRIEEHEGR